MERSVSSTIDWVEISIYTSIAETTYKIRVRIRIMSNAYFEICIDDATTYLAEQKTASNEARLPRLIVIILNRSKLHYKEATGKYCYDCDIATAVYFETTKRICCNVF